MRSVASLGAALGLLAAAGAAGAQGVDEFGPYGGLDGRGINESPQNAAFELRFGRYVPDVDSEFGGGATPYADVFGDDSRFLLGLEFDWQALRIDHFGSFGPGFGWGYTRSTGKALLHDGTGESGQDTTLEIMPMYLVGVLRVDVLARDTSIPIVPYAKAGLGTALWWAGSGDHIADHEPSGASGRGLSYGLQGALGGMLLLDTLDEDAALGMDATTGVNNSYVFVEWYLSRLDGFGSGDVMRVGANTWMLGLALEM